MRKCAIISNHYLGHWPKKDFPLLAVRSIICLFIYIIVSQTKKIIKVMKCLNSKLFLDIITAHLFPTPLHYKMAQTEPIVTLFGFPDGANIGQQWANHLLAIEPTTYTSRLRPFSLASYKVRYWSLSVLYSTNSRKVGKVSKPQHFIKNISTSLRHRLQTQTRHRWSSTNRQNPPIKQNRRNFWTSNTIWMPFKI